MIVKRLLLLLFIVSITGSVTFFYTQPEIEQTETELTETWQLPIIPPVTDKDKLFTQLRQWKLWGVDKEEKIDEKKKDKDKQKVNDSISAELTAKFVGVVHRGAQRYILLMDENNKTKPYYLNSKLPNGAQLMAIQEDVIEIQRTGEEVQVLRLYN